MELLKEVKGDSDSKPDTLEVEVDGRVLKVKIKDLKKAESSDSKGRQLLVETK